MNNLKISIITPSFNSSEYLEEAILSVLKQNYANYEHIIVDGGSTDKTLEILKKYSHLKWISEPDKGQSDAMNKGFAMSCGDIIVYLNADDYFEKEAFISVIPFFEKGHCFVVGKVRVVFDDGTSWMSDPEYTFNEMLYWWRPQAHSVNPSGYFYTREVQNEIKFNTENHYIMDIQFLLDASLKYTFVKIDKVLGNFRLIKGTKTQRSLADVNLLKQNCQFLDSYLNTMDETTKFKYFKERNDYFKGMKKNNGFVSKSKRYLRAILRKIFVK